MAVVSLVAAGLNWCLVVSDYSSWPIAWSQKNSTIKQICLTASSFSERQLSPFKDTSLLPRI